MYRNSNLPQPGIGKVKSTFAPIITIICLIFSISLVIPLYPRAHPAENSDKQIVSTPLFAEEEPLELIIEANFRSLIASKSQDVTDYDSAILMVTGTNAGDARFEIKVKARGFSRRVSTICEFPPLLLNFKKKEVSGTVFEGQNKLKLVTFCRDSEYFQDYIFHEYLIYKIYNLLTDFSFKVRLAHITYIDRGKDIPRASNYGFLIEDIDDLAERCGGEESDRLLHIHDMCDHKSLDIFTIFQFMIGNVDWNIGQPMMHNSKLISVDSLQPIPVPYDFDFCGAINTNYAVAPSNLPIQTVRQRLFRGYCRLSGEYENTIQVFLDHKEDIYKLYLEFPYISEKVKKSTLKYYDQFYNIISDPKKVKKQIYEACPANHVHLYNL
jgi:hypothetical protein